MTVYSFRNQSLFSLYNWCFFSLRDSFVFVMTTGENDYRRSVMYRSLVARLETLTSDWLKTQSYGPLPEIHPVRKDKNGFR